ncbi:MAG: hypothetical protein MZU97_25540 [Bacillus subtilis]|nr:hypothetical protein [Bacillus subtilis]
MRKPATFFVTFPADYHEKNLAGKAAVFNVKVHEIKVRKLPELNDEFVKDLNREGVTTLVEYKAALQAEIAAKKIESAKNDLTNQVLDQVSKNASFDVPEEMILEEVQKMRETTQRQIKSYGLDFDMYLQYMGKTKEEYEAGLKQEAAKNLRAQLAIEAVGKAENFEITDAEVEGKYAEVVEQYKSQNVTLEQARAAIPVDAVKDEIRFRKAVDFIVASAIQIE